MNEEKTHPADLMECVHQANELLLVGKHVQEIEKAGWIDAVTQSEAVST